MEEPKLKSYEQVKKELENIPIDQILQYRKEVSEIQELTDKTRIMKRQLKLKRLREEKIKLEAKLQGKIYCDDCKTWEWPSHFD